MTTPDTRAKELAGLTEAARAAADELRRLLCVNAVRDAAEKAAPLWLESADRAAERYARAVARAFTEQPQ